MDSGPVKNLVTENSEVETPSEEGPGICPEDMQYIFSTGSIENCIMVTADFLIQTWVELGQNSIMAVDVSMLKLPPHIAVDWWACLWVK